MNEIEEKNIVDNLINVLKTFHYSTNLPVWILKDKNMVFKQPENLITSMDILSNWKSQYNFVILGQYNNAVFPTFLYCPFSYVFK